MENSIRDMKRPKLTIFIAAFLMYIAGMLPILIASGGVYLTTGDMNCQTVYFWHYFNEMFKSGMPVYDWVTDLGMNFFSGYVGCGFLSPFILLSLLIPNDLLCYGMTYIIALKYAVAALGGYVYIRQYVKKDSSAFIGGMIYAFSGFQHFALLQPFSDSVAFFPFLLLSLDMICSKRKSFFFALMLALNGITNYYFFWEMCVFLLIYFFVKIARKEIILDRRLFGKLLTEAVIGCLIPMFTFLPTLYSLTDNPRAGNLIFDHNLLAYESPGTILRIIQSMFLLPEPCSMGVFFSTTELDQAALTLYLPLFSVVGVMYMIRKDRRSWESMLIGVLAIFAAVPLLNSIFSIMNGTFYARWYFMPLLIMASMTGKYADEMETAEIHRPLAIAFSVIGVFAAYAIFLIAKEEMSNVPYTIFSIAVPLLSCLMLYQMRYSKEKSAISIKNLKQITCTMCVIPFLGFTSFIAMRNQGKFAQYYIDESQNGFQQVRIEDDEFFRVVMRPDYSNANIMWKYPAIDVFHSLIPGTTTDFYALVGIERVKASTISMHDYPLISFLSVKYHLYYNRLLTGDVEPEPEHIKLGSVGFDDYTVQNRYIIYENANFIPMGFTYDYYLPTDDFTPYDLYEGQDNKAKDETTWQYAALDGEKQEEHTNADIDVKTNEKLLLKAIWLTEEQIEKYGDILTELPEELKADTSDEAYIADCKARAATSCYEFNTEKTGFTAKTKLEKDNLVFFSIPYDTSFTAYVDGEETEFEKVFGGLTAIKVPEGDHTIRFVYTIKGLKLGLMLTAAGIVMLAVYSVVIAAGKRKPKNASNQ
ncbi:MAG: YfhO family protein [Huintestinicola sp.]